MAQMSTVNVWHVFHISAYLCVIGMSIGALISYRNLNSSVNNDINKCILHAKPKLYINPRTQRCDIQLTTSQWGSDTLCNFVFFSVVASFVYGMIAVWFFVMCSSSTIGVQEDSVVRAWNVVPPASLFSCVMGLMTLVMAWEVSSGLGTFFHELELGAQQNCTTKTGRVSWDVKHVAILFAEQLNTQIFAWLIVVSWASAAISLVCRCATGADFKKDEYCTLRDEDSTSTTDTSIESGDRAS